MEYTIFYYSISLFQLGFEIAVAFQISPIVSRSYNSYIKLKIFFKKNTLLKWTK